MKNNTTHGKKLINKNIFICILLTLAMLFLVGCGGNDEDSARNDAGDANDMGEGLSVQWQERDGLIEFGGILWRVLDERDDKKLMISEYVLDFRTYHDDFVDVTWEHSDIRRWLNHDFYRQFTTAERTQIIEVEVVNDDNLWEPRTPGGRDTMDKIFLLSVEEVVRYFGDSGELARPRSRDDFQDGWGFYDEFDDNRKARLKDSDFAAPWWLRSPGSVSVFAAFVDSDGSVFVNSPVGVDNEIGVRPALWISVTTLDYRDVEELPANIEPDEDTHRGTIIEFGGLNWRVLDEREDRIFVISDYVLEFRQYHDTFEEITWSTDSYIRLWLNNEFYNNFTEEERSRIIEATVTNNVNPWFGTPTGVETTDKIFLLSLEEVVYYFGDSGYLANPRDQDHREWYGFNDQYGRDRRALLFGDDHFTWWWLRSSGMSNYTVTYVNPDGFVGVAGHAVDNVGGIRPAMWLYL